MGIIIDNLGPIIDNFVVFIDKLGTIIDNLRPVIDNLILLAKLVRTFANLTPSRHKPSLKQKQLKPLLVSVALELNK